MANRSPQVVDARPQAAPVQGSSASAGRRGVDPLKVAGPRAREFLYRSRTRQWFGQLFRGLKPGKLEGQGPRETLLDYGLLDGRGFARFRVNTIGTSVFITDGPWRQKAGGVFPYEDESEMLLAYLRAHDLGAGVSAVVDLAAGCGHTIIAHPCQRKFALDINPGARRFVRLNAALNRCMVAFQQHDVREPMPVALIRELSMGTLFVGNLPIALSPFEGALPQTADGGSHGNALTLAALRRLRDVAPPESQIVLFANSLGNTANDSWDLEERATELFRDRAEVQWSLIRTAHVWRVNGRREQPNPMELHSALPRKAECVVNIRDDERKRVRSGYRRLADALERKGWDRLGCGILSVRLP